MQHRENKIDRLRVFAVISFSTCLLLPAAAQGSWWNWFSQKTPSETGAPSPGGIFADGYPVDPTFRTELARMRDKGKLTHDDEEWIDRMVVVTSRELQMPAAVLWCLLFQESRLDRLSGIKENSGALGLGQFSEFSFFEVNHQLGKYGDDNVNMMLHVMGTDVRPVLADEKHLDVPSSYFYIPTAVVTSAAFLNNRYHQLKRILERQDISYDPDLLWLYASMAYNKGNRSVVTLWKDSLRHGGKAQLEEQLLHLESTSDLWQHDVVFFRGLSRIWPASDAERYAHELGVHLRNMLACSVQKPYFPEGS